MSMRKHLMTATILAALMALLMAVSAQAETLKPKVDNFILFVDYSGSMAMQSQTMKGAKIKLAKELIGRMNAEIPALNYQSGVNTFAPYSSLLAPSPYSKPAVDAAVGKIDTNYEIYGRNTPMGMGLMDLDPVLAKLPGKTALIIFTDGDSNYGIDPVAEAKALYAKYPDRLCIHVVSYADTTNGKMVVDNIRAISRCTVVGDPVAMQDPAQLKKFVRDVFYDTVADAPMRSMAPAAKQCETITFGNLNFGFDKYQITPDMEPALNQALTLLKESSCQGFTVTGHTDSIGTVPYNQKLSERRAGSVAKWLMDHGFTNKLNIVGKGKLEPKFDNKTAEGRHLNRRVEISTN